MKIRSKEIELVAIEKIQPNPKNRNSHSEEQIERLAEIIRYQGFRNPLIVSNQTGLLISGHGRLEAAKKLKLKRVPVIFQNFDDESMEYSAMVAENAIASWSELDLSSINIDIGDMGPDFNLDMLGLKDFTVDVADKQGLTDEDSVPEVPKISKVKLGDLFILGNHRLLCGDSTDALNVDRLMNGEKASLWSSDPPYGINHVDTSQEKGQSKGYDSIINDELENEKLQEFLYKIITISLPYMEKGFAFYMWHAMKTQAYFSQAAAAAAGILFHRQIIWKKPQFVFGRGHYHWKHELCMMGWLTGNEPKFYGERNQSTVWEIDRENDKIHPTQKPIELFSIPIRNHLKKDKIIYEPFAGSGSNFIAAEKTNTRCFGMELDIHYCSVILDRWAQFTGLDPEREDGKKWSKIKPRA